MIRSFTFLGALLLGIGGAAALAKAAPALPFTAPALPAPSPLLQEVQVAICYDPYGRAYYCPMPSYGGGNYQPGYGPSGGGGGDQDGRRRHRGRQRGQRGGF